MIETKEDSPLLTKTVYGPWVGKPYTVCCGVRAHPYRDICCNGDICPHCGTRHRFPIIESTKDRVQRTRKDYTREYEWIPWWSPFWVKIEETVEFRDPRYS